MVYHALLSRDLSGLRWWTDLGQHSAVPVAVVLWWLAFAPKHGLGPRHAVLWLSWPLVYVAYVLVRGTVDGRHPYFFVDPGRLGWDGVALWSAGLGVGFWLAGLGVVLLARRLGRSAPPMTRDEPAGPETG